MASPAGVAVLAGSLSEEERRRAARFRFRGDRDAFLVARAARRDILARYLGQAPARLRFATTDLGKPFLVGGGEVRFNSSRSGELALYAVARGREVGVDVERVRPDVDHDAIAARFFSATERDELEHFPEPLRRQRFFALWTGKEAMAKATSQGLAGALAGAGCAAPGWTLRSVDVGPGFCAAFAVNGPVETVSSWEWGP